jgi:hypothetical protein
VRRRSYFAGTAVTVVSLIIGVGVALAAGQTHHKKVKPKSVLLHCDSSPITVPPAGQANVDQPSTSGTQYGQVHCSTQGFGSGVAWDAFNTPDSGDMVGTYTQYFHAGSIKGAFDLVPGEGAPIGSDTFASQSFEGSVTVTDGTGIFKGVKGKNHKGTMSCNTPDSVHYTCTENVRILIPPPTTASTGTTGSAGAH